MFFVLFYFQFTEKHKVIGDRGFVRCKQTQGYFKLIMPAMLNNRPRLTQNEANQSRKVTMVRHVVERSFGRRKQKWSILASRITHKFLDSPAFGNIYRILAAIDNMFCEPLLKDQIVHELYIRRVREIETKNQSEVAHVMLTATTGKNLPTNYYQSYLFCCMLPCWFCAHSATPRIGVEC